MSQTEAPSTAATGDRLRWWTELPLIVMVYAAYSAGLPWCAGTRRAPSTTASRYSGPRRHSISTWNTR